jgi:hypothetical protein
MKEGGGIIKKERIKNDFYIVTLISPLAFSIMHDPSDHIPSLIFLISLLD